MANCTRAAVIFRSTERRVVGLFRFNVGRLFRDFGSVVNSGRVSSANTYSFDFSGCLGLFIFCHYFRSLVEMLLHTFSHIRTHARTYSSSEGSHVRVQIDMYCHDVLTTLRVSHVLRMIK